LEGGGLGRIIEVIDDLVAAGDSDAEGRFVVVERWVDRRRSQLPAPAEERSDLG